MKTNSKQSDKQIRVRTGIKSGISECCQDFLAYQKQNGNTGITAQECPPDSTCQSPLTSPAYIIRAIF